MSRVRETAEQQAGHQLKQGAKVHSDKKVMAQKPSAPMGRKRK